MKQLVHQGVIEQRILLIRGQRVILDVDLAKIYGVSTKQLNQQIKRNRGRFPEDFMFRLTEREQEEVVAICGQLKTLRSQIVTSKKGRGGRRYLPFAFTEHGALMVANILNSPTAVKASIQVVRAFVKLRKFLASHKNLARKLYELEKKYDGKFKAVFEAIHRLMNPDEEVIEPRRRKIGFHSV